MLLSGADIGPMKFFVEATISFQSILLSAIQLPPARNTYKTRDVLESWDEREINRVRRFEAIASPDRA